MKRGNQQHQFGIVAASEVALKGREPSRRVKLLPIGTIEMRDGRGPFLIRDKAHAEQIVAATQAWLGGADFNFDYDHQTAFAVKDGVGGKGKASGWAAAANITAEDDGIYANEIEWTPAAYKALQDLEYRYISPLFRVLPTGEVSRLRNAALVNVGGIDLPAIAAGLSEEEDQMDLTAIAAALGLAATATAQEIAAAAADLKAKAAAPATSTIAIAAGLQADAGVADIAAAVTTLKAAKPDPAKFVPVEQVTVMQQQLSTLNADRGEREVAAAIQAGKLAPALKEWGTALFAKSETEWRAYVDKAPVMIAAGAQLDERNPGEKFTTLSADEIAACEATGMSQADFLEAKNKEIA